MGDRGNIAVQESAGQRVYLYGHWSGYDMPELLRASLVRGKERWDDPQYLARVIFCDLVRGQEQGLTGFGITSRIHNNEYPVIVVDCEKQEIRLEAEEDGSHEPEKPKTWPIGAYAALSKATWGDLDESRKSTDDDEEDAA